MLSGTKEKRPLLFLHGYLSDSKIFFNQYGFFEKFYDCYSFDFTGFGQSLDMRYAYNLTDYINETLEFIYKRSLNKPFVIAHSFGGRVVIKTAGQDPLNSPFSKIVLTGPAGIKPRFSLKKLIKKSAYKILKNFLTEKEKEKFFSADYNKLSPIMKESFKLIVNEHLNEYAKKIITPTLIINGARDKETPVYTAKKLNGYIKTSKLTLIRDAGHFAFIDKKDEFNHRVLEFLTDNYI